MDNTEQVVFDKVENVHGWFDYAPEEHHYCLFPHNLLMACHKIEDVYQTIGLARICLENMNAKDFGDLIDKNDKLHNALMKSIFINNSISYYNYCIDLSWQVLWIFYNTDRMNYSVHKRDDYLKATKDCNLENLRYILSLAKEEKLYLNVIDFFEDDGTKSIRKKYNYLKHRGVYHIDGLGENYKESMVSYNGITMNLLYREELDVDKTIEELIEFDKLFVKYFNFIISCIIPRKYLEYKGCELEEFINYMENYSV